jgi:hypothetical protein
MRETDRAAPARQMHGRDGQGAPRRQDGMVSGGARNVVGGPERPGATAAGDTQIEAAIRLRAYERYLQRQGRPGSAENDWLEAEREVRSAMWGTRARTGSSDSIST